jgi:hypothetical protein
MEIIPGKPKKLLTQEMLQNLALAREKAKIKRTQMGELTQLKKKLAEKTEIDQINEIKKKLEPVPPPPPPESDEETEETQAPVKKAKKKSKPPIVIVEESESDSEDEQVVYIRRKSSKIKPHQILTEEPLVPETPKPPESIYKGFHPSMLSRRRY